MAAQARRKPNLAGLRNYAKNSAMIGR
jgi:hypothetical protein